MNRALKLFNIFIFLSTHCLSQNSNPLNIVETSDYVKKTFSSTNIDIKEIIQITKSKIDPNLLGTDKSFIHSKIPTYQGNIYIGYKFSGAESDVEASCSFNILNVKIGDIVSQSSSYYFYLTCEKSKDCIILEKNLVNKITIVSKNQTVIQRFRNSLIHLKSLLSENPELKDKAVDPFDTNAFDNNAYQISFSNIEFKDSNKNKRIDQMENCSLTIHLKNHSTTTASNIQISIKELNKIKGLDFNSNIDVSSIDNNQTKNIEIPINSNSNLEIGEAFFEILMHKNSNEIAKKTIKIATFNSNSQEIIVSKLDDVDTNIPKTSISRKNTYAIIIGNEDYKSKQPNLSFEANVKYANNDAKIFKEYLNITLGIPSTNIIYLINATSAEIKQAINKAKQLPLVNTNADIIFYYAGHGLPDEKTKEQYLIPVDVNGANLSFGLKINEVISELASNNPKQVLLILDACFSGAGRNESLLSNRGVKVRPKENVLKNNTIIISSSSNEEASKAYDEMQHGIFTYYLLKKIQETKGNVDLKTLFDFVHFNVREKSLLINNQFQTPTIIKNNQINKSLNEINF